jgi:hypothetical protein
VPSSCVFRVLVHKSRTRDVLTRAICWVGCSKRRNRSRDANPASRTPTHRLFFTVSTRAAKGLLKRPELDCFKEGMQCATRPLSLLICKIFPRIAPQGKRSMLW